MEPMFGESPMARLVPCRKCKQPAPLYRIAADMAESFSAQLVTRGEAPLEDGELVYCDDCTDKRRKHYEQRVGELVVKAAGWLKSIRETGRIDDIARQTLIQYGYEDAIEAAMRMSGKVSNRREEDDRP